MIAHITVCESAIPTRTSARIARSGVEQMGIDAGRHHLTTHLAPQRALLVEADATRITQIVANLLNNAAKYTPEGGHIQVLAERDGDEAVITVQDSGIGLSQDMLRRVFDMFAQVDRSMERAQGGLGIGLALVKRLVEMHGGTVHATSDGPDRGTTVSTLEIDIEVPNGAHKSLAAAG